MAFGFKRRWCDTERYKRAKDVLSKITNPLLIKEMEEVISIYDTQSEIISLFVNHPNLKVEDSKSSRDGKIYSLDMKLILTNREGKYYVKDCVITCQKCRENYTDERMNIGKDYHSLNVSFVTSYWKEDTKRFLLYQMKNQDKIESMCKEMNFMQENYFPTYLR